MSIWISIMAVLSLNFAVVSGYDLCYSTRYYEYYCDSPYECCEDNTKCCSSGLGGLVIFGIVIGSIVCLGVLIVICAACCKCLLKSGRVVKPSDGGRSRRQEAADDSNTLQQIQTVDNDSINQLTYHPNSEA